MYQNRPIERKAGSGGYSACRGTCGAAGARFHLVHYARVTRYPISIQSSSISILSSSKSILSYSGHLPYRYCHLPYRYCHLPYRYCHLRVIFRMDTVILSSCEQDDQIISCHSGGAAGDDFICSECSDPRRAGLQQVAHTSGHAACVRVTLRIVFVTVSVEEGVCTSAPHRTALSHTTPEPPQSAVRAGRVWG